MAWIITLSDIIGGVLLAIGYSKKILNAWFIFLLLKGIILAHAKNGWFVVGHQSGGIEYSVLLIICFFWLAPLKKIGQTFKWQWLKL